MVSILEQSHILSHLTTRIFTYSQMSNSNKKFKYGQERRKPTRFSLTSSASDTALRLVLGTINQAAHVL